MKTSIFIGAALICFSVTSAMAKPSINDMQGCQGVIDFVNNKLDAIGSKYDASDVATVKTGLSGYNDYIQSEIVTPGLLEFNGGDAAKADAMQQQVDAYKASITQNYAKRYPQQRLFTDFAMTLNDCAQQAVPSGEELEALKAALFMIIELAKLE